MNIKKLIASVVIALGAWMSVGVAQAGSDLTYYNFDYTATPSSGTGSVVGIFGVDNSGVIQSITGTVSSTGYDGAISGLLPTGSIGGNDNLYSPTFPFITGGGVAFYTGTNPTNPPNIFNLFFGTPNLQNGDAYNTQGDMSSSLCVTNCTGGVAPEMNTSLIPQVGLLLACLFFLLGRKKEVAVPMLVV